jgi:hypothetical protein
MSLTTRAHDPKISFERSAKVSTCRSCSRPILVEQTRVKIAYPLITVQYAERSGSPSFFMHLECFRDRPVDYVKDGAHPWKNWYPIDHFAYHTSQVEGLVRYPDAKVFFGKLIAFTSGTGAATAPSLNMDKTVVSISSTLPSCSAQLAKPEAGSGSGSGTQVSSTTTPSGNKRTKESPSSSVVPKQAAQSNKTQDLVRVEPGSNAKRPRILVQFKLPSFGEIPEECQGDRVEADKQYRLHLDLAAQREAAYTQQSKAGYGGGRMHQQAAGSKRSLDNPENKAESESDTESSGTTSGNTTEESESEIEEDNHSLLQWVKPGQLSRQVGISISVLRYGPTRV